MTPRVSVIIATYNRAHLLKTAINSVLAQTYKSYEVIVVDDGSSDETEELVRSYGDQVRYLHQENQGKSVALNNALSIAAGEWIAFLDSDDYWLSEKLEWQIRAIDQFAGHSCGACFTDGKFVNNPQMHMTMFQFYGRRYDHTLEILPDQVRTFAQSPAGVSVVTLLCRADLVREIGGFDPALRFTEDYDFVFRLALVTSYCLVNIPLVIIDRAAPVKRHTGATAIWDKLEFRLQCEQYRFEKWLRLSTDYPSAIQQIILKRLRGVHSGWANWYLANENYEQAQRELSRAAKCQLSPGLMAKWILAHISPKFARGLVLKREAANADAAYY